jgi:mRNA-degrading endonuclease HigB of HigAB toxin-antitoxin module
LHERTNSSQFIHKKTNETLFPQYFWQYAFSVAVLINPDVMQDPISYGIYAARSFSRHPLALSTLLNNCCLLYLVNNEQFLMPESFRRAYDKYVKAKTILFSIKGYKTRIIKNIIKNMDGSTFNLILHNVAIVDNFYCNIVSENRLARAKVWFCGFDATFRTGNL